MHGYVNASHANDVDTRKSVSSCIIMAYGCLLAYQCKGQGVVTEDTCSAELIAACACADTMMWLRNVWMELGCK